MHVQVKNVKKNQENERTTGVERKKMFERNRKTVNPINKIALWVTSNDCFLSLCSVTSTSFSHLKSVLGFLVSVTCREKRVTLLVVFLFSIMWHAWVVIKITKQTRISTAVHLRQHVHRSMFFSCSLKTNYIYRPQRSSGKVIFSQWFCSQGRGLFPEGLQFFLGGLQFFRGVSNFFRGGETGVSNFSWGSPIFWGVSTFSKGSPMFLGGLQIFFSFFFNFFPQNFFWDAPTPPPRNSQCASGKHPTGMHSCREITSQGNW